VHLLRTTFTVTSVLKLIARLNVLITCTCKAYIYASERPALILCVEKVTEVTQKLSCLHITQILLSESEDKDMIQTQRFYDNIFFSNY
jgi:hypothetical protein